MDTGTSAWTLPNLAVSGFETVSLRNINGAAPATDNGTLTFQNVSVGGTIIIDGLTMTATGGTATAAQIATAFATGATSGNAAITGADTGLFTTTAGPANNQVTFVSATPNAAVTPIAVTGTAQVGQQAVQRITLTYDAAAGVALDILSFSINGVTVRTAPIATDDLAGANAAVAAAINGYLGGTPAVVAAGVINVTTTNGVNIGAVTDVTNAGGVTNTVVASITSPVTGGTVTIVETAGNSGAGFTDTLDADNFVGATTFISDRSTSAVTIADVNVGTAITMNGASGTMVNGAITATYDAGNTAITFNATGGTGSTAGRGAVTLNSTAATDLTTVTINSSGATNRVGAIAFNGNATTVNVNASSALDVTSIAVGTNVAAQSIVVSGAAANRGATATGAPTAAVVLGTLDSDIDSVNASGLTAGGVSLTINDTAATITGGAGNDSITTAAGAQLGTVNAGAGTGDVLIQANTNAITTLTGGNLFSGFDVYQANNGVALDMDLIATNNTITAIRLNDAAGVTAITDMSAVQAAAITVLAANGAATLELKLATGLSDVMNILVSDLDLTSAEANTTAVDWTITNVETININAFDNLTMAGTTNITGVNSIVVTGAGAVSITTGAAAMATGFTFDYTGITNTAATLNFADALAQPITFLGSAGVDTVTDSVIGGNAISTRAGQDVITLTAKTGGTSGDIITGGAAGDSLNINLAYGNDAIDRLTLRFADGDSIISGTVVGTGYDAAVMDIVTGLDLATVAAATTGNVVTFDTAQSATAATFSATAVTFGTTAVTNAFDFYVYNTGAGGVTFIYQDTDGDRIIESGEFGIQIVGVAGTATTAGEFAVTTGNLVLTTVAG